MKQYILSVARILGLLDLWLDYKQKPFIKQNQETSILWKKLISDWKNGEIEDPNLEPKVNLTNKKVIWQYWGQGFDDNLPEIIKYCFDSVNKYCADYTIIRLSDQTVRDYIDLPDFVYQRLEHNPTFTRTFFSDLLRIALLSTYGGIWMDATICLTGSIPPNTTKEPFFIYQRSDREPKEIQQYWRSSYYSYWGWGESFKVRSLNAFMVSVPKNEVAVACYTLLLEYWRRESIVHDYFFFQVLFNELTSKEFTYIRNSEQSDCTPHLLLTSISNPNSYVSIDEALLTTTLHKLSSKGEDLPKILAFVKRNNL